MPRVQVNYDDLRNFSRDLKKFTSELSGLKSDIESKFRGMDWNDAAFKKFEAQFTSTMRTLKTFIEDVPEHSKTLERKATQLEEYEKS